MINAFKADLWYGASGLRKTSNIGIAAERWFKMTGKRTRLVSADGGGWEPLDPLVRVGLIVPWNVRLWKNKVEAADKACQGYWPQDPENPHSPLEPPTIVAYEVRCRRCVVEGEKKLVYGPNAVQPKGIICPTCKAVIGPRDIDMEIKTLAYANPKNDLREFALVGIEGLTSIGDSLMLHLQDTRASLSQDPSYVWQDGETSYAGGNMTYYGFVQNRLYEFVHKSHMIPFVEKVIWTALEGKGQEEATKIPIFGPSIVGKQATGKASQWFGNTLHFDQVDKVDAQGKPVTGKSDVVIYIRNHPDSLTKIPFQAKVRAPFQYAVELPDSVEADVGKLYDRIDQMKLRVEKETAEKYHLDHKLTPELPKQPQTSTVAATQPQNKPAAATTIATTQPK